MAVSRREFYGKLWLLIMLGIVIVALFLGDALAASRQHNTAEQVQLHAKEVAGYVARQDVQQRFDAWSAR